MAPWRTGMFGILVVSTSALALPSHMLSLDVGLIHIHKPEVCNLSCRHSVTFDQ
jgi:hypothetical protein